MNRAAWWKPRRNVLIATALRGSLKTLLSPAFQARMPVGPQRRWLAAVTRVTLPARGVPHRAHSASPACRWKWSAKAAPPPLLYLHGGGYVAGGPGTHRALTTRLARDLDATVVAVDYRLAPEAPCPAAIDDAIAVYRCLLEQGHDPARLAVAGDSAGGGLSLAFLQHLRHGGTLPLPAAGRAAVPLGGSDPGAYPGKRWRAKPCLGLPWSEHGRRSLRPRAP